MTGKICSKCKEYKPLEDFGKRSDRPDGRVSACKSCLAKDQKLKRKKFKQTCVDYKGGKCSECGYNKCLGALEFHHLDPMEKDFVVNTSRARTLNEKVKAELDKCVLLCANCHREAHEIMDV